MSIPIIKTPSSAGHAPGDSAHGVAAEASRMCISFASGGGFVAQHCDLSDEALLALWIDEIS